MAFAQIRMKFWWCTGYLKLHHLRRSCFHSWRTQIFPLKRTQSSSPMLSLSLSWSLSRFRFHNLLFRFVENWLIRRCSTDILYLVNFVDLWICSATPKGRQAHSERGESERLGFYPLQIRCSRWTLWGNYVKLFTDRKTHVIHKLIQKLSVWVTWAHWHVCIIYFEKKDCLNNVIVILR